MKRTFSIILALAMVIMLLPAQMVSVSAAFNDFPYWKVTITNKATVDRFYDSSRGTYFAKIRQKTGANDQILRYDIPTSYFNSSKTYAVKARVKTFQNVTTNQLAIYRPGGGYNERQFSWDYNGTDINYEFAGSAVTSSNNFIYFSIKGGNACSLVIGEVKLYNVTDSTYVSLPNLDFSMTHNLPYWTISTANTYTNVSRYQESSTWKVKLDKGSNGHDVDKIKYYVPTSKINSSHTYAVRAHVKTLNNTTSNWLTVVRPGGGSNDRPLSWDYNGTNLDYEFAGSAVTASNNYVGFGIKGGAAAGVVIDSVVVYDKTANAAVDLPNIAFTESEYDAATGNAVNLRNWKIKSTTPNAVVERVIHYNSAKSEWSRMIRVRNTGAANEPNKVTFRVPKNLLTSGHTYTVTVDTHVVYDMINTSGYNLYFRAGDKTWSNNDAYNNYDTTSITLTGCNLYSNNTISFGHYNNNTALTEWYLDNITVKDESTSAYITLTNPDLENTYANYVDFYCDDGSTATAEVCSSTGSYNLYLAWSKTSTASSVDTLSKMAIASYTASQSNNLQTFTITPETASGYTTKAYVWKASDFSALAKAITY